MGSQDAQYSLPRVKQMFYPQKPMIAPGQFFRLKNDLWDRWELNRAAELVLTVIGRQNDGWRYVSASEVTELVKEDPELGSAMIPLIGEAFSDLGRGSHFRAATHYGEVHVIPEPDWAHQVMGKSDKIWLTS